VSTPTSKDPYRNEIDALRERKESLEKELAQLRQQTTQLESLKAREAQIASELWNVDGRLRAGTTPKRALPMLDQIKVASPCNASWDEMVGDDRVRFCLQCDKNVFNLSSMSRDEAEALLEQRASGELCVRYYQRADGTIMTSDCPVGATKKRRKKLALAVAGAGAMALAATQMFAKSQCRTQTMGAVAMQGEMEMPTPVTTAPPVDTTPFVMGTTTATPPPPPRHMMGGIGAPPPAPPPDTHVKMGKRSR
jgi:hypothetical protein